VKLLQQSLLFETSLLIKTLLNYICILLVNEGKEWPNGSRGTAVSIVSDYGLDDRAIGIRSPAEAKDFSSSVCPDRLWGLPGLLYNGYRW
jgi:hypothetical protein